MSVRMRRREFITLLGAAAAAWPLAANAQQPGRMRRVGVLMPLDAGDPEAQARLVAFVQGLQEQGWTVGRNVQLDIRWAAGEPELFRRYAAELVALAPDVILGRIKTRTAEKAPILIGTVRRRADDLDEIAVRLERRATQKKVC
jgi:hypothetical protein